MGANLLLEGLYRECDNLSNAFLCLYCAGSPNLSKEKVDRVRTRKCIGIDAAQRDEANNGCAYLLCQFSARVFFTRHSWHPKAAGDFPAPGARLVPEMANQQHIALVDRENKDAGNLNCSTDKTHAGINRSIKQTHRIAYKHNILILIHNAYLRPGCRKTLRGQSLAHRIFHAPNLIYV